MASPTRRTLSSLPAAWRRLSSGDRRAFAATSILIPAMAVAVRLLTLSRLYRWLSRHSPLVACSSPSDDAVRREVRALRRAQRRAPFHGNCLSQSLALWWRLRRAGIAADLHLGVAMKEERLLAHAWVEHDGRVLNDPGGVRKDFSSLGSISAASSSRRS